MGHHCHALGCKSPCPPRWLMCSRCWSRVPLNIQAEVNRTVGLRGPVVDATWAPWWRAQETRHKDQRVAMTYIRHATVFDSNATEGLGDDDE